VRVLLEEGNSGLTTTTEHTGTERYLAYELVTADDDIVYPTTESDIWALACLGLEVRYTNIYFNSFLISMIGRVVYIPANSILQSEK
jgi:serine/threonine protein kinase